MTDLDNEDINKAVVDSHVIVPRVLTETEKLVEEARAYLEQSAGEGFSDLLERLTNRVEELDKKLTETVALYKKERKAATDAGWEIDAMRQDYYYSQGRDGW